MLVNFRRGADPFPYYSISDIINHKVPPEKLEGKIVLVGATAHGLGDRGVTPVNPDMPRVEIHANAIDNMLQGDFLRRPIEAQEIALVATLLIGIAMSLGVAWLSAMASAALGVILLVGYYAYAQNRLLHDGLVIGIVFPMFAAILVYMFLAGYRYITEGREKRYLRNVLRALPGPRRHQRRARFARGPQARRRKASSRDPVRRYRQLHQARREDRRPRICSRC